MAVTIIDAKMLSKMFLAGAKNLDNKKEWINDLNVFPVPDGDTGTNMTMTILSAAKELQAADMESMTSVCKAISSGSLRGARGNSGVILSQLIRGFTKVAADKETLTVSDLADAFERAVETAYKAVMKPKEGTILTVAKGGAVKARELAENGVELDVFMEEVIRHMDAVLEQTPEMLPVLKQAGVVDSGGQGLMQVLKGASDVFQGKEIDLTLPEASADSHQYVRTEFKEETDIKFGYCTEFIILLNKNFNIKMEMDFKAYLESIGDSIVVVADDDLVKVHVHTNDPGLAIQRALKYGALSNLKIDNMRLEHQETLFRNKENEAAETKTADETAGGVSQEKKETAFIAVAAGSGISEIFKALGVDYIIEGGQTMNPSTEDMINAIEKVNADNIIILPNNKNIILAANQASTLVEDRKVYVVPTKTLPQGITAVINYIPDMSAPENVALMEDEINNVRTGEVTYAIRDTSIDNKVIRQGDFMGIGDHGILSVGTDRDDVTLKMLESMVDESVELISVYYGQDVEESEAQKLSDSIREIYPKCDIELQFGGQPIYYYIISAE